VLDFHRFGATLVKCNDTGGLDDLVPQPEAPVPPEVGATAAAETTNG
jgi:hypothetical protein